MVKVQEEGTSPPITSSPIPSPSIPTTTNSISGVRHKRHHHHHHHLQHTPLQHFHHFHHHWTFPEPNAPATFHFGPGFEPQFPRFVAPSPGPSSSGSNGAGSVGTSSPTPGSNGNGEHVVHFHVNPGVTVSFQIGDNTELIRGPVTVPMVSTNSSPPIAMPVQVPPGHVVQQIVDESGTLRHVILSPQPQPQPQPIVPMHNPHNYGAGNGNTQPPQTFYAQGLPPGYPPPHYHSNMPPGHLGHVQSGGHLGHSPPPAHGFHKDERTQRQYNKLKRKLEQKRSDGLNSGQTTPLLSPRKELVNGLRRGAAKERGMNSVGTSEDGEESSSIQDDEDEVNVITDILSSVQTPQVSELSSRSALLQWSVPSRLTSATSNGTPDLEISESELRYDVLLSDKGKEGKYKSIYSGASLSCRIQDLKPGQEYSVCLQVHLDELQGSASDPMTFTTPACEPDQPLPPKLIGRTKTSLQLRWNATTDNGSHILQYILEYDEGKGGGFQELSKGRGKQYHLTKLQPSTVYRFRLAAVNECGKSNYSDVISFSTSGSPPPQPAPPILKDVYIDSLRLVWNRRPTDDEFTLQMDEQTGYGYMNSYVGKETEYLVPNLRRYSDHKFRLRTSNEENVSSWSDEVCFRTLPDRPGQPARPVVKGRIHAHSFKLKWEPPHDKGGADITAYILELSSGSSYETVYTGSETEAVCDKLAPGTTYQLRVSCMSAGGRSNYSDPCTVTTEAICPGKCSNLRLHGKPRATSLNLKWTEPDYNGGAPVTEYELDLVNPELSTSGNRQTVYRGKEPECTVTNLLPGNTYSFMVRALNRVGSGPWSDVLDITSGAASPDAPLPPVTIPKSPFHIYVEWQEPNCNGAALTEYKLEMSNTDQEEQYSSIFQGLSTSHDVKGLAPFTTYFFRVQASNSSGCSLFSQTSATMTPASIPSTMIVPRYEASPVSLTLFWHPPASNGSDILNYVIEIADRVVTTDVPVTEHTIDNLKPETLYKIKIKAVNNIGSGIFSPTLRASTLPLPPPAPKLDCIAVGHNYLKLKWGDGKNADFTQYCLEMEHNRTKEFHCIYHGTNFTYKVNKLQELTTHRFRISASSDAGEGDFSDVYEFKTCIAPPIGMKAPKIVETTQRTCGIEWAPCKISSSDPIEYTVQLSRLKEQDYKVVYRGPDVKMILSDLEPGTDYNVRVCPVRLATSGELQGVYSPSATFQTAALEPLLSAKPAPMASASPARRKNQRFFAWITTAHSDKKPMSDTQWAIVIIAGFTMFAIVAAVVVEQFFINWGKTV